MRSSPVRLLPALLLVLGVLAACGDEGDAGDASSATGDGETAGDADLADDNATEDGNEAGGGEPAPGGGGAGTVTVDGTTYDIDETRTCDPAEVDVDIVERELELQGAGSSGDERVQIDVYIEELGGTPTHQVSWSGPEGIYGGAASDFGGGWTDPEAGTTLDGPPIEVDGDRVSGELSAPSSTGDGDSIDVSFDLALPTDFSPCR